MQPVTRTASIEFRGATVRGIVCLGLIGLCAPVRAGVLVESVRRAADGRDESTQSMLIQNGNARMESSRGTVTLFKNDTLYILNAQRKTYTALDRETAEQTADAMNDAKAKMREKLADMPPEQRAMMEKMLQQHGMGPNSSDSAPPTYDAIRTGASDEVAGYKCNVWTVKRDGQPWAQLCVVPYRNLPSRDELQSLRSAIQPLLDKFGRSFPDPYSDDPLRQDSALGTKLNGVPFVSRHYRNGQLETAATIVTMWRTIKVSESQFEIPADYTRQELPTRRANE